MKEITGIDYLTGAELPLSELVHVSELEPGFSHNEADYIARFCYKYGVGNTKKPPVFVSESALQTVRKARRNGIEVEIQDYKDD